MYEKLLDLNNLYDSAKKCEKGVSWKESVQRHDSMILPNILTLRKRLEDKSYVQKSFNEFDINERGKKRHIKSLHISDRVSVMVLFYCKRIIEGKMTLEQVPDFWKEKVSDELKVLMSGM